MVQNPPAKPLTQKEMDDVYALPYMRCAHPDYEKGRSSGDQEIKFSLISNRGCFGGCSFCADLPPGANRTDTKPRISAGGGKETDHAGSGF